MRISDDPEGTEKGVDRQEADCRAYAQAHGYDVVEVFRENDTSAFKQRTIVLPSGEKVRRVIRPRFRAMLQLLARREADVMVAYDLDRAVRDPRDLEDLIDSKVLYGFGVASTTGSLRLDSDSDIAMARVLVAMANKSSADTARRVARASRQQALDGKWHGGRAPYGYRMADSRLHVIPERAVLAREAADRVLAGESLYAISRLFNERGDRTGNGKLWSDTALRQILRNPALKGVRIYRPVLPDGSKAATPELVTQGDWTAIIDPDTWDQVNAVLDTRKARRQLWPGGVKRVYPFSGIIQCSHCASGMYKRGASYVCFNQQRGVCSRTINAREVTELVEDAVFSVFSRIALTPDKRPRVHTGGEREELAAALESDQAALQSLDDDRYDGIIDKATWVRQRTRLVERIQARQRDYQSQLARMPVVGVDVNMATVASEWPDRPVAWQHEAARLVLEAVLIHAHPEGVPSIVNRRRGETTKTYQARLRAHRERLLARRVEFIWRA